MSQSNERGRGSENKAEREYLVFAMNLVGKYLSAAIFDVSNIFPRQTQHLIKVIERAKGYFNKDRCSKKNITSQSRISIVFALTFGQLGLAIYKYLYLL